MSQFKNLKKLKYLCCLLFFITAFSCSMNQGKRSISSEESLLNSSETLNENVFKSFLFKSMDILESRQIDDGSWTGAFISDVTQDATYLAAGKKLGKLTRKKRQIYIDNILSRMEPSGQGWVAYPGGPIDPTVTGFTLKVFEYIGFGKDQKALEKAWDFYESAGGDDIQNSTLKMQLYILGIIPGKGVAPPISASIFNLPYNMVMKKLGIHGELLYSILGSKMLKSVPTDEWKSFSLNQHVYLQREVKIGDSPNSKGSGSTQRTQQELAQQIISKLLQSRGKDNAWYGTLFTVANLIYLQDAQRVGLGNFSKAIDDGWKAMDNWYLKSEEGFHAIQPMRSDIWDTGAILTVFSKLPPELAPHAKDVNMDKAFQFLIDNQVEVSDNEVAWSFDSHDRSMPDIDDTAAIVHAFAKSPLANDNRTKQMLSKAIRFILVRQNNNGGFPAWSKGVSPTIYNFLKTTRDFPEIADVSQADITSRVLHMLEIVEPLNLIEEEYLAKVRKKGCQFLERKAKRVKGISTKVFVGHWFTNYSYSASSMIDGLIHGHCRSNKAKRMIVELSDWLIDIQQENGGWGEDNASYLEHTYVEGPSTLSQTVLILVGLIEAREYLKNELGQDVYGLDSVIEKGIDFLYSKSKQGEDFFEKDFTAILVKGATYSRYELLPLYGVNYVLKRWYEVKVRD